MSGKLKTADLQPCPFCGQKPDFLESSPGFQNGRFKIKYQIQCPKCGIDVHAWSVFFMQYGYPHFVTDGYTEVKRVWNSRAGGTEDENGG